MSLIFSIIFVILWLAAVAATFFPVVPATIIIWAAALLHALLTGFQPLDWTFLIGLALVGSSAFVIDNLAAAWGARKFGGSSAAGWGALLGGIAGIFVLPPFGFLICPVIAAVMLEMLVSKKPFEEALKSGIGTLVGMLGGIGLKLLIHIGMGIMVILRLMQA
jgi:uncharacterized protein YqgC (DUF456 family)